MTTLAFESSRSPFPDAVRGSIPPDPAILERNLAALARASSRTAELVRYSAPRTDIRFLPTDDGVPSVETFDPLGIALPRAMASRRRPLREGEQLAETIDIATTAAVAVMGFGAGYHVGALARSMRRTGVIAVFEPDVALLRAVLERIDHSEWISSSNTVIFTDPDDAATITAALSGVEGIVMMGLSFLEHAPSVGRLGESRTRFYKNFQDVIAAVRTTVATTMVQVSTTVANVVRNLPWYVTAKGIAELGGTRAGTPAIVVSAGPSLQRNIEQLSRPGVRDRFTIIAAQTVLKPLLARGIRPHFVVALDHSEISARFYEGLTREDVEGVTLVVEPKVSPAVPLAFPGEVRLARDPFLDMFLGQEMARDMGTLPPGATVAHLAYYLARYMGADPVVLVGQDLGFTDGQYYAASAAIHDVWACELNQFNSLERMEWERIKRMGSHLRRATDHLGRPIFTDEQLATYLVQFERDFLADTQRGMTIIDATEGGVAKRHTHAEALGDVVDRVLGSSAAAPRTPKGASQPVERISLRRTEDRVRAVQRGVNTVADLSRRTVTLLQEMLLHHADQRRVSRLIDEVHRIRDEVEGQTPAIELVHYLNQAGAFSRIRADRSIQLDQSLTPLQRQRREIERDIANVELLARTAGDLALELGVCAEVLVQWQNGNTTHRPVRDRRTPAAERSGASPARAHAVVAVPADAPLISRIGETTALRLMLQRLGRSRRLESIVLLAEDPDAVRREIEGLRVGLPITVQPTKDLFGPSHRLIRAARSGALECWRGGLAGASIFDEVLAPEATLRAMTELSIDAALIVGRDWCLVDPLICDDVIERSERGNGTHRFAFSQAPPGAAGLLLNKALLSDLIKLRRGSSPFATLGGLLAYLPSAPSLDPIGREGCALIEPSVRDVGLRVIPDAPHRAELIARAVATLGSERAISATSAELVPLLDRLMGEATSFPTSMTIEIDESTDTPTLAAIAREFAQQSPGGLVTIRMDARAAARLTPLVAAVRSAGSAFFHIRATLDAPGDAAALIATGADIISVDLPDPTDTERWNESHRALEKLVELSRAELIENRPRTWVVPRLTKCDASYPVMEGFFDRWLLTTGAAAIDPLPQPRSGERLAPLPLPAGARRRLARHTLYIRSDGSVHAWDLDDRTSPGSSVADSHTHGLAEIWRLVLRARAKNGVTE